jgi:murein DD-endopeptidase MepM/ murein hydrolase activator NlpD
VSSLEHRQPGRGRRLRSLAVACVLAVALVGASALPALAEDPPPDPPATTVAEPDPPDTTVPEPDPPDTTVPEPDPPATTVPEPDPTTTTLPPDPTTTTLPADPSTTTQPAPDPTATLPPPPDLTLPANLFDFARVEADLSADEALECHPEFASLNPGQRALVDELQRATDAYAVRRFPLDELGRRVAASKDVLTQARAVENVAVNRELFGPAEAVLAPDGAAPSGDAAAEDPFRAQQRRLEAERKDARRARVQALAQLAAWSVRLEAQKQSVTAAAQARDAAESALERELGAGAVHARRDGVTATLEKVQADQPDPIVVGGIGQALPGAALSSPFGVRNDPLCAGAGFHAGLDIAAPAGTPIHAAAAGVVVIAGGCDGYGNCVVIDHGAALATLYGHQSVVHVRAGDQVEAGQVIGLVGSTGRSTGPHLHFEVRLRGLAIDPFLALTTD